MLIEIALEPIGENQILTVSLPVHEHGTCLHLIRSLIYHNNVLWFTL